jgi:hypothetical protein
MHKNNRLKESISAFFSRFVISFPLLLAQAGFHRFHNGLERLIFVFSVTGELNHIPALGAGAEHAQNALGVGCELPKGEGDRTFKTHGLFTEVPGGS